MRGWTGGTDANYDIGPDQALLINDGVQRGVSQLAVQVALDVFEASQLEEMAARQPLRRCSVLHSYATYLDASASRVWIVYFVVCEVLI